MSSIKIEYKSSIAIVLFNTEFEWQTGQIDEDIANRKWIPQMMMIQKNCYFTWKYIERLWFKIVKLRWNCQINGSDDNYTMIRLNYKWFQLIRKKHFVSMKQFELKTNKPYDCTRSKWNLRNMNRCGVEQKLQTLNFKLTVLRTRKHTNYENIMKFMDF